MNQPYESYKPSGIDWLGDIPSHWEVKQLKYLVADKKNAIKTGPFGSQMKNDDLVENGEYKVYTQRNVLDRDFDKGTDFISEEKFRDLKEFEVFAGDVLFTTRGTIGQAAIVPNEIQRGVLHPCVIKMAPDIQRLDPNWLLTFVNDTAYFVENVLLESNSTVIEVIYSGTLKEVVIPVPPLGEQRTIYNYIHRKTAQIDDLVARKEQLLALLQQKRQAIINEAVTRGLDANAPKKDSGIEWLGEIPAHWEVKKLKHVASVNPTKKNFISTEESQVVFLPMEKVSEKGILTQDLRKKVGEVEGGLTYFERNDILIAKITPCFENGKGALLDNLVTDYGFGSTEFHVVRAEERIASKFIFYLTKGDSFNQIGEAFMTGSAGQKRVPTSFVENFPVALPPFQEQSTIISYLDERMRSIDQAVSEIKTQLTYFKTYRQSLISEVVTGKVDVRAKVTAEV